MLAAYCRKSKNEQDIEIEYDHEADVLYVSFGGDEVSFSREVNEDLVLDIGMYSGLVTGFRVISPKKKNLKSVLREAAKQAESIAQNRVKESLAPIKRLNLHKDIMDKVLA